MNHDLAQAIDELLALQKLLREAYSWIEGYDQTTNRDELLDRIDQALGSVSWGEATKRCAMESCDTAVACGEKFCQPCKDDIMGRDARE